MKRFVAFVAVTTVAGLLYVFTEVEAVKIGYSIRKQQEMKTQAFDRSRALKYNIARLKAPQNLERRLVAQRITLASPKEWQTLVLTSGKNTAAKQVASRSWMDHSSILGRLFVGTAQAEAKESSARS